MHNLRVINGGIEVRPQGFYDEMEETIAKVRYIYFMGEPENRESAKEYIDSLYNKVVQEH